MHRVFFGVSVLTLVFSVGLLYKREPPKPIGVLQVEAPKASPVNDPCEPRESLAVLKDEIKHTLDEDRAFRNGSEGYSGYAASPTNPATNALMGLVVRARDCYGVKDATDVGLKEEYWRNLEKFRLTSPREKP